MGPGTRRGPAGKLNPDQLYAVRPRPRAGAAAAGRLHRLGRPTTAVADNLLHTLLHRREPADGATSRSGTARAGMAEPVLDRPGNRHPCCAPSARTSPPAGTPNGLPPTRCARLDGSKRRVARNVTIAVDCKRDPALPRHPIHCRPAGRLPLSAGRSENRVGGDWYDRPTCPAARCSWPSAKRVRARAGRRVGVWPGAQRPVRPGLHRPQPDRLLGWLIPARAAPPAVDDRQARRRLFDPLTRTLTWARPDTCRRYSSARAPPSCSTRDGVLLGAIGSPRSASPVACARRHAACSTRRARGAARRDLEDGFGCCWRPQNRRRRPRGGADQC